MVEGRGRRGEGRGERGGAERRIGTIEIGTKMGIGEVRMKKKMKKKLDINCVLLEIYTTKWNSSNPPCPLIDKFKQVTNANISKT